MRAVTAVDRRTPVVQFGGPMVVDREDAPLGRLLTYRRTDESPPPAPAALAHVLDQGWSVNLGARGLGDMLLALAMATALHAATGPRHRQLIYRGPRPDLMARCDLPLRIAAGGPEHRITTATGDPTRWQAMPEHPPTWLSLTSDREVRVYADLPMRYYLAVEQALGIRLPADGDPCPAFTAPQAIVEPGHIMFVEATSMPGRKDYGRTRYAGVAANLRARWPHRPWRFTLVTGHQPAAPADDILDTAGSLDAVQCIDLFATAEAVVGNDTGLTHLAALTRRADQSGPIVLGLYGRHSYTKWTTGSPRQHAIATPFSHLMSIADACPVRDGYDDTLWAGASSLDTIPTNLVTTTLAELAGWTA